MGEQTSIESDDIAVGRVIRDYGEAKRKLEGLMNEAGEMAERFARLAHGLSSHPARVIIGHPEVAVDNPSDWDVVPGDPLPRIEGVIRLTDDIREASAQVEQLRERLILSGRADVVQQPDEFFH